MMYFLTIKNVEMMYPKSLVLVAKCIAIRPAILQLQRSNFEGRMPAKTERPSNFHTDQAPEIRHLTNDQECKHHLKAQPIEDYN